MNLRGLLSLLFIFHSAVINAEAFVVRYPGPEESVDPRGSYFTELLQLALDQSSDKYGAYQMKQISVPMYQERQLKSVESGLIDVMWTMTSKEREKIAKPVYIPLMKGLLGYRVFIINKKDKQKFLDISATEELRKV